MNNEENTTVVTDENVTVEDPQTTEPDQKVEVVDADENAKKAVEMAQQLKDNAKGAATSQMKSIMGYTKTVKIGEDVDPDLAYSITLRFPGVARASDIIDGSENPFGNLIRTAFLEECIRHVVVSPKIKDLDEFFDTHIGYNEVFDECRNFLNQGLNGKFTK